MIYLFLTILLNALLAVIFKLFARYNIDNLQAIVIKYWVCVITGSLFLGEMPISAESSQEQWFPLSLIMGIGFILVFNLFAFCTKHEGITAATIANKLSLVIPVVFSIWLYSESLSALHIMGIALAFPAVYLAVAPPKSEIIRVKNPHLLWIAILFLGSGLLDTGMKFAQQKYLESPREQAIYTIHLFAVAGFIGTCILLYLLITKRSKISLKNILGGIALGIPNYFSIYFMIRMLNSDFLKSSALIPLSNIGVLLASTLAAIIFFRERMTNKRLMGICLSLVVIAFLALA
ncbi:MAG: EamA family transporter [Chitinophagaceae bacterium]|nr:EamA family transporter [Chitinophagaceae bacterium]